MSRDIVVLTGRAGAGKTTIALQLVESEGFHRVRFAGALKAMTKALGLNDDEIDGHLKEVPCEKLTLEHFMPMFIDNAYYVFRAILSDYDDLVDTAPVPLLGGKTLNYAVTSFLHVVLSCVVKGGEQGATPRSLMQMIGTEWGRQLIRKDLWIDIWRKQVAEVPDGGTIVIDDCRFPNEYDECRAQGHTTVFRIERDTESALAGEVEKSHESEAYQLPYDQLIENNSTPADAAAEVRRVIGAPSLSEV